MTARKHCKSYRRFDCVFSVFSDGTALMLLCVLSVQVEPCYSSGAFPAELDDNAPLASVTVHLQTLLTISLALSLA
ncbi:hypothetical protein F5890DRAFT_1483828, partial [Lentinula detonsa]